MTPTSDLLSRSRNVILVYWTPSLAIALSGFLSASSIVLTTVWTVGFAVMGVACLLNAMRCGRVHCYFMGPFLLLAAGAALLLGLGAGGLGVAGWRWLGAIAGAGAAFLMVVPERLWGRYADWGPRARSAIHRDR